MKCLAAVLSVFMLAGTALAAPKAPALKITKITGTVNLMKDGMVVMTLKAGDALPSLVDPSMTFAVVEGSIEVEAAGHKITGATGSNFTVNSNAGQVNVTAAAGAPVEVKNTAGNTVVLTENSSVKMVATNGKVEVTVEKGSAVVSNTSGATQTVKAGEKVEMVVPAAPVTESKPEAKPEAPEVETPVVETPVIPVPDTQPSVIPTQELSPSNP